MLVLSRSMSRSSKKLKISGSVGDSGGAICNIHFQDSKSDTFILPSNTTDPESRFQTLREINRRRLSLPQESQHRLAHICCQIPTPLSLGHGYHQQYYQRFIGKLDHLMDPPSSADKSTDASRSSSKRSSSDRFIFNPDCIFCHSRGTQEDQESEVLDNRAYLQIRICWWRNYYRNCRG